MIYKIEDMPFRSRLNFPVFKKQKFHLFSKIPN